MKSLSQHIEKLILKHECVIVPSLGGFIIQRQNAIVLNDKILSPFYQIRFNSNLTYHDGLLIESYMKEENVCYEEALHLINKQIYLINKKLSHGEPFSLGNIGQLVRSYDGNISLITNNTFIPYNAGLPKIQLSKLQKNTNNNIIPFVKKRSFRYAAIFIAIFSLTTFFPININDQLNHANLSFNILNNKKIRDNSINKDSLISPSNYIMGEEYQNKSEKLKRTNSGTQYHLIIASLNDLEQANLYISAQTDFPQKSLCIIKHNNHYRISAHTFSSYNKAIAYMDSIKKQSIAKTSWIWRKHEN